MAFPSDQTNQTARWSQIQQILDVLQGVSGGGDRVQLIQYNNSSNYVLDVKPIDTTNGYALRVRDGADAVLLTVAKDAIVIGADAASDLLTISCNIQGKVYIGDSANGEMTIGLTINQAGNDDQAIALKSSDVAHAVTDVVETDTYADFRKVAATGGLYITGLLQTGNTGLALRSIAPTDVTTKVTGSSAYILLDAAKKNSATVQDAGTNANLLAVRNNGTTRLIVDAEGHLHSIGATATDMLGNGLWFLNDTACGDTTLGIVINQGTNDNAAIVIKSSDLAHGMTTLVETDTYAYIAPASPNAAGGLALGGYSSGADTYGAVSLVGRFGANANETKGATGFGIVSVDAAIKTGTTVTTVQANGNLFSVANNGSTRLLVDAEGEIHIDSTITQNAWDEHEDAELVRALEVARTDRGVLQSQFDRFLRYNRADVERLGLATFNDQPGGDGSTFVNYTALARLHSGAIWQLHTKLTEALSRLAVAEAKLQALPGPV